MELASDYGVGGWVLGVGGCIMGGNLTLLSWVIKRGVAISCAIHVQPWLCIAMSLDIIPIAPLLKRLGHCVLFAGVFYYHLIVMRGSTS